MMFFTRSSRIVLVLATVMALVVGASMSMAAPVVQEQPLVLVYGQTVDGRLNSAQPSLSYSFDGRIGDTVTVTMIVTEGDLDPFMILRDPVGGTLITDDNSGGGLNARLTFILPADGRYGIVVSHAGSNLSAAGGSFTLNLTVAVENQQVSDEQPDSDLATVGPVIQGNTARFSHITSGVTVRERLGQDVTLRVYWFEAQAGDQVTVSPEQFSEFQPLLVLCDSDFTEIARAAPGTGLRLSLSTSGIFFVIVVLPHGDSLGGNFGFSFSLNANPASAGNFLPITYGETVQGSLNDNVPGITYQFRGLAGDEITVLMRRTGGDLNSYLYLLDAAGQLLYEDNDSGGGGGDAQITYSLPQDGDYLILAARMGQAQGTTSGSFVLELRSNTSGVVEQPQPEAVPTLPPDYEGLSQIAYGDSIEGQITDAKFMDVYVFLGTAGDSLTIEMVSQNSGEFNGLDPYLVLLDAGRIPLIDNDDIVEGQQRDSRIEFVLPNTGYYAIVATRFEQAEGTTAGPYVLTLSGPEQANEAVEPATVTSETGKLAALNAQTLVSGVPAQETFSKAGRLYTFSAEAGALVDLAATLDGGSSALIILADSDLNELQSSASGTLTGLTLERTGAYLVILMPRMGPVDTLGSGYILALNVVGEGETGQSGEPADVAPADSSGPRSIGWGETLTGVIDDDTPSQFFTFQGITGERVRIEMMADTGSTLDSYLELQDAEGAIVASNDDIAPGVIRDSRIEVELPGDGEYVIVASRYVGEDAPLTSGAFRLTLQQIDTSLMSSGVSSNVVLTAYGRTESGEITDEQYLVFYVFDGNAGDMVTIDVETTSGNLDAMLYLYQSVGNGWIEIANNDDSPVGGTYDPLLSKIVLPQTGKYLIAVGRYGLDRETSFGTFTMTLMRN